MDSVNNSAEMTDWSICLKGTKKEVASGRLHVYNDNRGLKATRCQRILTTLSFTLTNAQRRKRKVTKFSFAK